MSCTTPSSRRAPPKTLGVYTSTARSHKLSSTTINAGSRICITPTFSNQLQARQLDLKYTCNTSTTHKISSPSSLPFQVVKADPHIIYMQHDPRLPSGGSIRAPSNTPISQQGSLRPYHPIRGTRLLSVALRSPVISCSGCVFACLLNEHSK